MAPGDTYGASFREMVRNRYKQHMFGAHVTRHVETQSWHTKAQSADGRVASTGVLCEGECMVRVWRRERVGVGVAC